MAGIGFELRKLVSLRSGLITKMRAYASAGLISSGPWIMTALTLCLVSLGGGFETSDVESKKFRALVTYAFAFSLITVGAVQMAVTRWIADSLYCKRYGGVLPAFVTMFATVGVFQVVVATIYGVVAGFPLSTTFVFAGLYVVISLIWLALIWLTVIREYNQILLSYGLGTGVSMFMMAFWGTRGGLNAYLGSYAAGQALTLVLLVRLLVRGMETSGGRSLKVWGSVLTYPALVGTGLFYNLAIWIDKVLFWFVDGVQAANGIYFHPLYDTCCFLAYVTVIPALALNLVHLETSFYEHYRAYYQSILGHLPLSTIQAKREAMMADLRGGITRLLRVQGAVSATAIVLAPWILERLGLPEAAVRVFRLACLGAFFHILLLITILIQLYFDLRKQALASAFVFLVANATLTWWTLQLGFRAYGVGYALASLIAVVVAFALLDRALKWLDYLTFSKQLEVMGRD